MRGRKLIVMMFLTFLPLFLCMKEENETHVSSLLDYLGKSLNFIILFGGLVFVLRKPIKNYLENRCFQVEHSLKEAEELKREGERRLQEVDLRLKQVEEELEKIIREGEGEGVRQRERILKAAIQEAERLKDITKKEIENLIQLTLKELKAYVAEIAVSLAIERIMKRMSPEDHQFFIDQAIEKIEKLHDKSNSRQTLCSRSS